MYVADMRGFCDRFLSYSDGLTREQFSERGLTYGVVVRNIELLGEAARQVPQHVRDRAPQIEWQAIIALRNILTHAYFGIDDSILWDVVTTRIEPLQTALTALEGTPD
jgi:uncharacterized protein with HEPN domain